MTRDGVSLLTVVMHELGHLLGYEHSADGLMAPVLGAGRASSAEAVEPLGQAQWRTSPSSPILHPSSSLPHPSSFISSASRADDVFAELESSDEASSPLLESQDTDVPPVAPVRSGEEATQARVPRRSRVQRYERELDEWFAQLAVEAR